METDRKLESNLYVFLTQDFFNKFEFRFFFHISTTNCTRDSIQDIAFLMCVTLVKRYCVNCVIQIFANKSKRTKINKKIQRHDFIFHMVCIRRNEPRCTMGDDIRKRKANARYATLLRLFDLEQ